jgi:hypothetical protein
MMPARVHPVKFNIQHMGYPGERVPVELSIFLKTKRPCQVFFGQTGLNLPILGDVNVVIIVDKIIAT